MWCDFCLHFSRQTRFEMGVLNLWSPKIAHLKVAITPNKMSRHSDVYNMTLEYSHEVAGDVMPTPTSLFGRASRGQGPQKVMEKVLTTGRDMPSPYKFEIHTGERKTISHKLHFQKFWV